jgi:hypothetical protein
MNEALPEWLRVGSCLVGPVVERLRRILLTANAVSNMFKKILHVMIEMLKK